MSDEIEDLVGRLLDWPYQGETMAAEAAVLIKQLTAERDRLREALEYILAECTLSDNTTPSVGAIKYAARAALKGETP